MPRSITRYPPETDIYPFVDNRYVESYNLAAGDSSVPRPGIAALTTMASGVVYFTFFTGKRSQPINNVKTLTSVAAGATPTLCKIGIYTEALNGDLTKTVETANDTTLWAGSTTVYTRVFTSTWNELEAQRYALAVLVITAAALPSLYGVAAANSASLGAIYGVSPRIHGFLTGQTDLPSSVTNASVATNGGPRVTYGEFS